ncbi:MAG TPA: hypothetical protein VFQ63_03845, partial [Patescibacteria group bacterium]|nr:hypothetical protein [Patescibacteria group bacterium]
EQPTQETTRRRSFAEGVQEIRDALRFEFYGRPPLQPQEPQHRYGQSGLTYEVNQPQGWWGYLGAPRKIARKTVATIGQSSENRLETELEEAVKRSIVADEHARAKRNAGILIKSARFGSTHLAKILFKDIMQLVPALNLVIDGGFALYAQFNKHGKKEQAKLIIPNAILDVIPGLNIIFSFAIHFRMNRRVQAHEDATHHEILSEMENTMTQGAQTTQRVEEHKQIARAAGRVWRKYPGIETAYRNVTEDLRQLTGTIQQLQTELEQPFVPHWPTEGVSEGKHRKNEEKRLREYNRRRKEIPAQIQATQADLQAMQDGNEGILALYNNIFSAAYQNQPQEFAKE